MKKWIQRRFRKYVSKVADPDLPLQIGNQTLLAPLSHPLRNIMPNFPDYNHNLGRIVASLEVFHKNPKIIDIGANIGDSVAYIRNYSQCPILCIEGSSKYFKKLQKNLNAYQNTEAVFALVTDDKDRGNLVINTQDYSGSPTVGTDSVPLMTLEKILEAHPDFEHPTLLKTDTDGFDTIILRDCQGLLQKQQPVLFFEFDPWLIERNGDNALTFLKYLHTNGYTYFIIYTNHGDLLMGVEVADDFGTLGQLVDYFSGHHMRQYADVVAYPAHMKQEYETALQAEQKHFANRRGFTSVCA